MKNEETRLMNEETRVMNQNDAPKAAAAAAQPKQQAAAQPKQQPAPKAEANAKAAKDAKGSRKGSKKDNGNLGRTLGAGAIGAAIGAAGMAAASNASAAPHRASTLSTGAIPDPNDTSSPRSVEANLTEEEMNPQSHEPSEYVKGVSPEPEPTTSTAGKGMSTASTGAETPQTAAATASANHDEPANVAAHTPAETGNAATPATTAEPTTPATPAEMAANTTATAGSSTVHAEVTNTTHEQTAKAETHIDENGNMTTTETTTTTTTTTTSTYTHTSHVGDEPVEVTPTEVPVEEGEHNVFAEVDVEGTPYGEQNHKVLNFLSEKGMTEEQMVERFGEDVIEGKVNIFDTMNTRQEMAIREGMQLDDEGGEFPGTGIDDPAMGTTPDPDDVMLVNANGIRYAHVDDDMSFGEAFAAAREQVGAGGAFIWRGNTYGTYYAEEWDNMSTDQRGEFVQAVNFDDTYESLAEQNNHGAMGEDPYGHLAVEDLHELHELDEGQIRTMEGFNDDDLQVHFVGAEDEGDDLATFTFEDDVIYDHEVYEGPQILDDFSQFDVAEEFNNFEDDVLDSMMDDGSDLF